MRVCFIVSEYFLWGSYGGYGTITRSVAEGLVARGHEVYALVPRRTAIAKREQPDLAEIEGVQVIALPHSYLRRIRDRVRYRWPAADVYVSTDARFDSWMAARENPDAAHCIWLVDPMSFEEYWDRHAERVAGTWRASRLASKLVFEGLAFFSRRAVKTADLVMSQTERMANEGAKVFGMHGDVVFAPNPVEIPDGPIDKSPRPLVLFLGRFDRQKQPTVFFELARRFPSVDFVAAGEASDPDLDAELRHTYSNVENLRLPGLVTGEAKDRLLREAWILCNTSLREGLPRSFQEGLAYGCSLLSSVDPDRLVSRFGHHVPERDFARGLQDLLRHGEWQRRGLKGRQYVSKVNEHARALDLHENIYRTLTASKNDRS
jgi:glycosyltransferase involved in cell wall biosynthesis